MTERQWPPDPEVVTLARGGDSTALELLLQLSSDKLGGFFLARGCTLDQSRELAAETLSEIITHLSRLRRVEAYRSWMWSLGRSVFRRWIRDQATSRRLRSHRMAGIDVEPGAAVDLAVEHKRIAEAYQALKPSDQLVLWLRDVEELGYDQVARARGGTASTARVATHRARRRLRDLYSRSE